jgi:hypothetical protein
MLLQSFIFTVISFFSIPDSEPTFKPQVIDDNVSIGYGLAIGDVDGDKKPDILLADKKEFVWYRNGDWKRFVMIENLTESDNVCIAARDINGDGVVEVAVGAQWNPGETSDAKRSGSVHYLIRPEDPTKKWTAVELHHEPTIHRMQWVHAKDNIYHLVVVPLHGRGNKNGEGKGVKIFAYQMPKDPHQPWPYFLVDESMHLTHNFDVVPNGKSERIYLGGKEGVKIFSFEGGKWTASRKMYIQGHSFGEVRVGRMTDKKFVAGVEPMHGNELTVYLPGDTPKRQVLTTDLKQGHALATSDFSNSGTDQIVIGWREPNGEDKVGIKIYIAENAEATIWKGYWVDDNDMACEDLKVADLNDDGKKDIIAAGRNSHNLKVYWGR